MEKSFEAVKPDEIEAMASSAVSRSSKLTAASTSSSMQEDSEIKMVDPKKYTTEMNFQYVDFVKRANPQDSPTLRGMVRPKKSFSFPTF